MRFLLKETFDEIIVSSAFQKNSKNLSKALKTNIIYAGHYYTFGHTDKLRLIILKEMEKYNLKSVMMTILRLWRFKLITKEIMIDYCLGKDEHDKQSVNDDLNSFFDDLRLDKNPQSLAHTYFLPKLTDEELKLIEEATGGRETEIIENNDYQKDSESDTESDLEILGKSNSKMNVFEISNLDSQITEIENEDKNADENKDENEDENEQNRRPQTTTETQNIFRCCFIQ